jgi:S1-C subfamily serine protease
LRGVLITGVAQDSPAENAGLRAGDVVTRVAQTPVATPEEFRSVLKKILDSQSSDKKVALYVKRRGGDSGYVLVTLNQ